MGLILFTTARFLQWLLTPVFFIYAILRFLNLNRIYKYFADVAFGIDQLGNVMGAPIMNDVLLKKDPIKLYGNPDETISYVTGINYVSGKCTIFGITLSKILDFIQPNHVENASKNNQNN